VRRPGDVSRPASAAGSRCRVAPGPARPFRSDRPAAGVDIEARSLRLPAQPPTVSPPRPFNERRRTHRRTEDRNAHREKVLLAHALDVLASDVGAEERLAGLLRLLARTAGARRAAVLADGIERRAAVAIEPGEDPTAGAELAAWLDAHAPRSRARRAAAGQAPISFIVGADDRPAPSALDVIRPLATPTDPAHDAVTRAPHYAILPIPSAGEVVLGFEFERPADAARVADRLPPTLARHAAVALALVTAQLASERELASLRARDAERATFVSTVAHELRTPLTGLRGYLELILDGRVGDAATEREFLDRSRTIVGSMGDLVADLLELSRLESGTLELEIGPFSIAEAGGHVAAGLLPIALDRQICLTTDLPPRLRFASGDRRRVEQILTNLAANALKFTPSGGAVEIVGRVDGLTAVFTVRDDGAGIPPEDRAKIFERFHRMAGHERITGTGLGLPIARDLARQMSGDLDVASVRGAGSAFVLVLPGPALVPAGLVDDTLARVLDAEERALEEQAVRRAIQARDRSGAEGPRRRADRARPAGTPATA
jgi:signal transduction histidine kinase